MQPDSDDDSDWEPVPVTLMKPSAASVGLDSQPLDVVEALALQLAKQSSKCSEGTHALAALESTCRTLRDQISDATCAWDVLSHRRFTIFTQPRVDLRVGFPFVSPASRGPVGSSTPLDETAALVQLARAGMPMPPVTSSSQA